MDMKLTPIIRDSREPYLLPSVGGDAGLPEKNSECLKWSDFIAYHVLLFERLQTLCG